MKLAFDRHERATHLQPRAGPARHDPARVRRARQAVAALPSLGLLTLAGMTPDRFDVSYHEIQDIREASELPACDVVAISTFTAQVKEAHELARRYRNLGVSTIIGGLRATALPEEAAHHVDAVVAGEGEVVWADVLVDAEAGKLHGVYRAAGREWDLAQAPMPRFDLLEIERYNRITVQTTRGCPWRCEFCASSILLTSRSTKPVDKVIAEVRAIKSTVAARLSSNSPTTTRSSTAATPRSCCASWPPKTCAGSPRPTSPSPTTRSCST